MTVPILLATSILFVMLQVQCFSEDRVSHFMMIADTNNQEAGGDAAADRDHLRSVLSMSFGGDAGKMRLHIIEPTVRMSKVDFFSLVRSHLEQAKTQAEHVGITLFLIGQADEIWTKGKLVELRFKLSFVDDTVTRSELLLIAREYSPDLLVCITENLTESTGPAPNTAISATRSAPCAALVKGLFIESTGEHLIHGCSEGQKCQSLTAKPASVFSGSNFISSFTEKMFTNERETVDWPDFLAKVDAKMLSSTEAKQKKLQSSSKQMTNYQRQAKAEKQEQK